ncbi:AMP-binding protein [Streptomyces griseochromogenes]|uniref:AMP-binding protein n=1 Tax=Streptomyces griseochromogenes TaxID=68214 RepID=UPI0037A023C8
MRTVVDLIRANHRRRPGADALVTIERTITHGELSERAWAIARLLVGLGVERGTVVGHLGGNSLFTAAAFLGTAAAGGVFTPYNWRWSAAEFSAAIDETGPDIVFFEDGAKDEVSALGPVLSARPGVRIITEDMVSRAFDRGDATSDNGPPHVPVDPQDPLCILFTGGTTGTSKGVVLSHGAAMANAVNETIDCGIGAAGCGRGLIVTPMFHSAALICWFLTHYVTGSASVMLRKFDLDKIRHVARHGGFTDFFMVPSMLRTLLAEGLLEEPGLRRNLRAVCTGAGVMRLPDKVAVSEALPRADVYVRYGLTEAGPMVTRLKPDDFLRPELDGSIGQEYLFTEVQIQDEAGVELPPHRIGEICVRGPALMTGYYRRPAETAQALRGGWLHTGDLGERDNYGYIYFRDRSKDMIKSGGENVYSAEVEELLLTHPAIREAAVFGVPSEAWDEEVRAVIVPRSGQRVDHDQVVAFLRGHLAGYKIPKRIKTISEADLPRNPIGKILKRELRAQTRW